MENKEEKDTTKKFPLKQEEAQKRKQLVVDKEGNYTVEYNLLLVIRRSKDKVSNEKYDFEGKMDVNFSYHPKEDIKDPSVLFLNFVGMIHQVKINGQEDKEFKYENHRLIINLSLLEKEKQNKLIILFKGRYTNDGVGCHHYLDTTDQKEYLYTQFEPYDCNQLFPCFDQPDIKAKLHLTIVSPDEWTVLSNEIEHETFKLTNEELLSKYSIDKEDIPFLLTEHQIKDKNYKVVDFNQTPKISTYLFALCAGPYYCITYQKQSKVPLRLFMRESFKNYGEPDEIFRVVSAGFKFYEDYFGIQFPFSKYDQIFCPEYNMGAMENVGLITLNEIYCWKEPPTQRRRSLLSITLLHELAHMWFGNLVTMTWWDDLWLNEAFATFISHLCMAKSADLNDTYTNSWILFCDYKGSAYSADQKITSHPVMFNVNDTELAETSFDVIVYEKGSSILKQMYYYIGDETFSKGLKAYFAKYKWQNTVFNDLVNKIVEVGGDKLNDLPQLCTNWLKKPGLTEISSDIVIDSNNTITQFTIKQKACLEKEFPSLQSQVIDILFVYDFKDKSQNKTFEKILIEAKPETQISSLIKQKAPKMVLLNYNDWGYMKIEIDRRSIDNLKTGINDFDDTLSRQLIYRSLYDSVRDGKMSSIEYLEILLSLIEGEKDDNIRSSLLRYINTLISSMIPIKYSGDYRSKMFDKVLSMLATQFKKETISKDIIKQLFAFLPVYSSNEDNKTVLVNLLKAEKPSINGVEFNPVYLNNEIQLSFVTAIYRSMAIKAEEKAALLEMVMVRNNKDNDALLTELTCKALNACPNVKKELWEKYVHSPTSDSMYNMIASMSGFAPLEHKDIIEDYVRNKFFDAVPLIGKNTSFFYTEAFVDNLGPDLFVDEETIAKLEKLGETVKEMVQVKKCVLDKAEDMKLRLKCHKLCEAYLSQKK